MQRKVKENKEGVVSEKQICIILTRTGKMIGERDRRVEKFGRSPPSILFPIIFDQEEETEAGQFKKKSIDR